MQPTKPQAFFSKGILKMAGCLGVSVAHCLSAQPRVSRNAIMSHGNILKTRMCPILLKFFCMHDAVLGNVHTSQPNSILQTK